MAERGERGPTGDHGQDGRPGATGKPGRDLDPPYSRALVLVLVGLMFLGLLALFFLVLVRT